jgi:hypothetical protein
MSELTIEFEDDRLHITLRGPSTRGFGLDLYTAAITALIEEADTRGAEKTGDEDAAPEFYAAILAAVARHYAADSPDETIEDRQSAGEIVAQLLGHLRAEGRL